MAQGIPLSEGNGLGLVQIAHGRAMRFAGCEIAATGGHGIRPERPGRRHRYGRDQTLTPAAASASCRAPSAAISCPWAPRAPMQTVPQGNPAGIGIDTLPG